MILYHYTCDHGRAELGDSGKLIPPTALIPPSAISRHPKWQQTLFDLIWLTDLDVPLREALGLTSNTVTCDRTQFRYRVEGYSAMRWTVVRRDFPKKRVSRGTHHGSPTAFSTFKAQETEALANERAARHGEPAGKGHGWCPTCWVSVRITPRGFLFAHKDYRRRDCYQRVPFCPDDAA
jgi:hypothetical protein